MNIEQQIESKKAELAALEKQLEESKKTKYAIGQVYFFTNATADIIEIHFTDNKFDNEVIAMGNDAFTVEEAERKIRRRKAVVKYNEIVHSIIGDYKFGVGEVCCYLQRDFDEDVFFNSTESETATDLKPVYPSATTEVLAQLTPELINDLFCI
jgi:hypothetical protein